MPYYLSEDFQVQDYLITNKVLRQIVDYANACAPKEACGIVIENKLGSLQFIPTENVHDNPHDFFTISSKDILRASSMGEIKFCFHSHPTRSSVPSDIDKKYCDQSKLIWVIYSLIDKTFTPVFPEGVKEDVEGRQFLYGFNDCFSLAELYYASILDIRLPYTPREYNWWERGISMYTDNYDESGFVLVANNKQDALKKVRKHDLLVMSILSKIPNHAAIYLGDEKILHHLPDRLSRVDNLNTRYRNMVCCLLRPKELQTGCKTENKTKYTYS